LRAKGALAPLLGAIDAHACTEHEQAVRETRDALSNARFQRLMLAAAWVNANQDIEAAKLTEPRSARAVSRKVLERARRKAVRRGRDLDRLTPEEMHALRRDLKKLRYTAAFAATLQSTGSSKRFLSRLADLQDVLGKVNDLEVAKTMLERTQVQSGNMQRAARLEFATTLPGEDQATSAVEPAWKKWRRAKSFWSKD
jgi:CHAD domain-containing protein